MKIVTMALSLLLLLVPAASVAEAEKGVPFSVYAGKNYPMNVYWGDTHIHTRQSLDAGTGGQSLGPEEAYRFAKGEEVELAGGLHAKLHRPLDFLVVSDHAEYLGIAPMIRAADPELLATEGGRRWYEGATGSDPRWSGVMWVAPAAFGGQHILPSDQARRLVRSAWELQAKTADAHNQPGVFTALIGFEWSSAPGYNLHRNVIFRDGASRAIQVVPFSALDSLRPEDLWAYLENYERRTGGMVLAIPHNSNLSNGAMFALRDSDGKAIDARYAETRARWEPLVEVTQTKGDSETHPLLSPDDGFADFDRWDWGSAAGPKEDWMLKHEYARSALKLGLDLETKTGANPYRFGMIGSTDAHTALPVADEDNWWGVGILPGEDRANQLFFKWKDLTVRSSVLSAAGYAAVWATENSREALFDAMKRREVYATTGSRMVVRFFGGWQFAEADAQRPHLALAGYEGGVPMGSDLPPRPEGAAASTFLVSALKNPEGANLDRIQIVKGWRDADGQLHERVYDAALGGDRSVGAEGEAPQVGNTVDIANATYTNSIGAAQLATVWTDPDFDVAEPAFYYARVIEIPTPRWTAYEVERFGFSVPEGTAMTLQERAYTSPIWYTPPR